MSEFITLNPENINKEHICCAISDKKCQRGVKLKKEILKNNYSKGHRLRKLNVKGKVFIEYAPSEEIISPLNASGYMHIQCFWVSGQYKGQGYGKKLLESCIESSKEYNGLTIISSKKKKPFLADSKFLHKYGFEVYDEVSPFFQLMALKFKDAPDPKFSDRAKEMRVCERGLVVYYTEQCPFMDYYVNDELVRVAKKFNLSLKIHKVESKADAMLAPTAFPMYTIFLDGEFFTHEIMNEKRFEKLYNKLKS